METIQRDKILTEKLNDFYNIIDNFNIIYDIYTNPKISLRVIDWFVTNYSKKNNINYYLKKIEKKIKFNVYTSYKSQLKSYSKKYFDPFCRRDRIQFYHNNDDYITTTVGQLNFFKWTIKNSVLSYIENNLVDIEKDMNDCYKAVYSVDKGSNNKGKSSRRKRQELSISATKKLNKSNVKIYVSFD